jgi:hypothetical protein
METRLSARAIGWITIIGYVTVCGILCFSLT